MKYVMSLNKLTTVKDLIDPQYPQVNAHKMRFDMKGMGHKLMLTVCCAFVQMYCAMLLVAPFKASEMVEKLVRKFEIH